VPLHKLLEMKDWHHYCKVDEVVTQFCGFKWVNENKPKDKKEWKAEPIEHYSRSFSKLATVTALHSADAYGLRQEYPSGGIVPGGCLSRSYLPRA